MCCILSRRVCLSRFAIYNWTQTASLTAGMQKTFFRSFPSFSNFSYFQIHLNYVCMPKNATKRDRRESWRGFNFICFVSLWWIAQAASIRRSLPFWKKLPNNQMNSARRKNRKKSFFNCSFDWNLSWQLKVSPFWPAREGIFVEQHWPRKVDGKKHSS